MESPVIVDYDPGWPEQFEELAAFIWPVVERWALRIEHVGSTSVPGLAAKPIIDLDVVVAHKVDMPFAARGLESLGYENLGDLGLPGRLAFELDREPKHHLYLVVNGNGPHANHIGLRDHLRTHPDDAARYAAHKRKVQHLYLVDREAYTSAKDEFIHEILKRLGIRSDVVEPG